MKIACAEEATQKHVSALPETKTISAVKSTPRSQSCQQNKPDYSIQPKRPPFRSKMSKSNKDVFIVDSITTGTPPDQCTKPPATSVVKRATGKKSASLNSTARMVKASKWPHASQQPETNSMHLNMPERQTARTLTKQLTSPLTL